MAGTCIFCLPSLAQHAILLVRLLNFLAYLNFPSAVFAWGRNTWMLWSIAARVTLATSTKYLLNQDNKMNPVFNSYSLCSAEEEIYCIAFKKPCYGKYWYHVTDRWVYKSLKYKYARSAFIYLLKRIPLWRILHHHGVEILQITSYVCEAVIEEFIYKIDRLYFQEKCYSTVQFWL